MEQLKERCQHVDGFSKLKFAHFREILKERTVPGEMAQRNLIPEYPLIRKVKQKLSEKIAI